MAPWYGAYALVGLLVNGLVPLLLPLTAAPRGPVVVSLVVAAFFAGQLTAPIVGGYADRRGVQRAVFLGSFPVMAAGAVTLGLAEQTAIWIVAAAVAGAAAGAAQTTASVFVVEGHPAEEWDQLIGCGVSPLLTTGGGRISSVSPQRRRRSPDRSLGHVRSA